MIQNLICLFTALSFCSAAAISGVHSIAWQNNNDAPMSSQSTIKSVETKAPVADSKDVFHKVSDKLWGEFWSNSSWKDSCKSGSSPVVWQVAVAGEAIDFGGDEDKISQVVDFLKLYRDDASGGYSAGQGSPESGIYTDDDAQVQWVLTLAGKVLDNDEYLDDASDLMQFIMKQKNPTKGGITWQVNGSYIASISTLEAGLAAIKLYEMDENHDYLEFSKYCINWTYQNLHDTGNGFFYDGLSTNGEINKGELSYTVGVALSTLVRLEKHDSSKDWHSMAVDLAARTIGYGNLNSEFYSEGYISNQIEYSHLLFLGLADFVKRSMPKGNFEDSLFDAVKNELVREIRHLYDQLGSSTIDVEGCPKGEYDSLLSYASLVQSFYSVTEIAARI
ncbi:Piso0_002072 [Millerozyma farinosa CBS 7064]|uniref:Piso0_002072 protein n=1 Tax=Pichia sorbitophila (strain ATCC MYA-4447 / BCRC 22081 / CBS 7064 / NBRC 10061 / NRRL Y-12695) TaxID=559304 RepID=G8YE17_PICSO|nr:Piso0_002072 [Millerozyma farinosa CBS 7064]